MIRFLALLLLSSAAFGATVGELEPATGTWRVYRSGTYVCAETSEAAALACASADVDARKATARYQIRYPNRYVTVTYTLPAPICTSPAPPVETRTNQCTAPATGSWTQTRAYVTAPYPTCWTAGAWLPTGAPTGSCVTTQPPPSPPTGQVLFRETFNSPTYGFAGKYTSSGWTATALPTGDADGSGAVRVRVNGGIGQFPIGWWTPNWGAFDFSKGIYVSFRIKFDDDSRWAAGGSGQNKFILLGNSGGRTIIHIEKPSTNSGCTLGWRGDTGKDNWMPRDFGLTSTTWGSSHGSVSIKQNVGWTCSPPVAVTYGNNANPGIPAPNAIAATGNWYSITMWVKPGQGNGEFRVWVNNKEFSRPNIVQTGITMGTTDWEKNAVVGGYWTDAYTSAFGYTLGEVAFRTAFDASF